MGLLWGANNAAIVTPRCAAVAERQLPFSGVAAGASPSSTLYAGPLRPNYRCPPPRPAASPADRATAAEMAEPDIDTQIVMCAARAPPLCPSCDPPCTRRTVKDAVAFDQRELYIQAVRTYKQAVKLVRALLARALPSPGSYAH